MSARRRLKPVLGRIGIHSAGPLWLPLALRAHHAKLARDPAYRAWLESAGREVIRRHWGEHDPVRGEFFELHLASQVCEITETMCARIGIPATTPSSMPGPPTGCSSPASGHAAASA